MRNIITSPYTKLPNKLHIPKLFDITFSNTRSEFALIRWLLTSNVCTCSIGEPTTIAIVHTNPKRKKKGL